MARLLHRVRARDANDGTHCGFEYGELFALPHPLPTRDPVALFTGLGPLIPPVYPPRCLRMGIEGTVRVKVLVGEDGRPQEVTLGKSSGESALDEAAMDAVRTWRFEPARRNGVPVRAWAIIPIEFKLID